MRRALIPLVLIAPLLAGPAAGQRAPDTELRSLQAEYRDEQVRAARLRLEADQARGEIRALEAELARLGRSVGTGDVQVQAQRARLQELGRREADLVAVLSRTQGAQGRLLSALQMMTRDPPPPLLIPAERAIDTVRASILMKAMAPELKTRADAVMARQTEVQRVRRLAALSSERLFTLESAQSDRRGEIEGLNARKRALEAVMRADAARAERAARTLEARIRTLGGTPSRVEPGETEARATRLPGGRERLTAPLSSAPAGRYAEGSPGWRWSPGAGTVRAPAAGVVDHAGPLSGWGQVVILNLGPGWRAVVTGLDSVSVAPGDRVADGQTLGRSGPGDEVYFELRREERPIDPGPWLR